MLDLKDVNKSVRGIIRTLLAMPADSIRPADQNAPAGKEDQQFGTVKLNLIEAIGDDAVTEANEASPSLNIAETITGHRRVMASVNFYRGDAFTKATRLEALLRSSTAGDLLQAAGLGLIRCSEARNLTAVNDTKFEERGQLDIEFSLASTEVLSIPTYGRFPVTIDDGIPPITQFEVIAP